MWKLLSWIMLTKPLRFQSHKVHNVSINEVENRLHIDQEKISLYVWKHKNESHDHLDSLAQNGGDFGYILLNDLKISNGPPVHWEVVPGILEAHEIIRFSGVG